MIYCVEDDNSIRDLMIYTLNASGFEAKGYSDGNQFLEEMSESEIKPDLILLDIMLPGIDGIEILKRLKKQSYTSEIPVIMATAKGTEYDKIIGLDLGADDYLAKPFGMMEMISRIKAVMRRTSPKNTKKNLNVGNLEMNITEHTVLSGGEKIILTLKEFELLRLFMENVGQVFTRDTLMTQIWGADFLGETRTVDVHIGTLRTKLGKCSSYIETIRGVGYRMINTF